MKKDITTKKAIKSIAKDIIKYILKLEVSNISFVDKELQRVEKREADLVISCKKDNRDIILHIEIQNSNDKKMVNRMLRYYADIKNIYPNRAIEQHLIYIGKDRLNMTNYISEDRIEFSYNLIDMHDIDCEEMLKIDKVEALILAILCDFKGKKERDILLYILKRLKEFSGDSEHKFAEYMLTLEILSTNRDLKEKLKEAEKMLRDVRYEELPSYEIGLEIGIKRGIKRGIKEGIEQGIELGIQKGKFESKIEDALIMIKKFKIDIKDVAKELSIPIEEIQKRLKNS